MASLPNGTELILAEEAEHFIQCRAKSKQSGEQCRRPARTGYPVCSMHGAGSGDRHPGDANLKHGKYSRFLRMSLTELQQQYLDNEEPQDLSNELAMLRALLQHLMEGSGSADDPIFMADFVASVTKLTDSIGLMVARMEKLKNQDAIPRTDVARLVRQMESVAQQTISDPEELQEMTEGWRAIRVVRTGRK